MTDHDLRTLLEDAVADVEPRHALADIQARTAATRPRRPWVWGTVAAVAATAATVAAVTVVTDRSPQQSTAAPPAPSQSPDATPTTGPDEATRTPTTEPTDEPTGIPGTPSDLLPVYFVGDTPAGPRLFREFQHDPNGRETGGVRALTAIQLAMYGDAADPDYRSAWPDSTDPDSAHAEMLSLPVVQGEKIEIGIGADPSVDIATRPSDVSAAEAELAIQQVVYTAQAATQERTPVVFTDARGYPLRTLLGVDVSQPVTNQPEASVQAPVWVIDPQDGATVGTTFEVNGRGAFFEATVSWQLLQGSQVVKDGFTTADEGMTLSPYSFTVRDVPPGAYTLRVYDADVSGGEGNGEQEDTKRITVR